MKTRLTISWTSCSLFLALCQKSSEIELGMGVVVLDETKPESPLVLVALDSCLVECPIHFFGDAHRLTVAHSEVIRVGSLNVTHQVQGGAWLFS